MIDFMESAHNDDELKSEILNPTTVRVRVNDYISQHHYYQKKKFIGSPLFIHRQELSQKAYVCTAPFAFLHARSLKDLTIVYRANIKSRPSRLPNTLLLHSCGERVHGD